MPRSPYKERIKVERILLLMCLIVSVILASWGFVLNPGPWATLYGWEAGLLLDLIAASVFGLILGLVAYFRHHTAKAVAGNRTWEISFSEMLDIEPVYHPIDKNQALNDPSLTPDQKEELAKADLEHPGTNEFGEIVQVKCLPLGGFRWAQFYSDPGEDGYVLIFGLQWIQYYQNVIFPRNLVLVDHSKIDREVLNQIEVGTKGKFKPYHSPLYECGDLLHGDVEWLRKSPEARAVVLEAIGIPGLARAFARHLKAMPDFEGMKLRPSLVIAELRTWLEKRNLFTEAVSKGYASPAYWRKTALGLQGEVTRLQHQADELKNEITWWRRSSGADAQRRAGVYTGGYTQRRAPPPPVMEDREKYPGIDRATPYQD